VWIAVHKFNQICPNEFLFAKQLNRLVIEPHAVEVAGVNFGKVSGLPSAFAQMQRNIIIPKVCHHKVQFCHAYPSLKLR
jgi:hypothetical protein